MPIKFKWMSNILEKGESYNNKFTIIRIVFIFISIVIFKLLELFILYNLSENIDDYVLVYNHIKKNSLILFLIYNMKFNKININKINKNCYTTLNGDNKTIY